MAQSQVPNIPFEALLAAAQSPSVGQAIQAGTSGFEKGMTLADTMEQRKAERKKMLQELELKKQQALAQARLGKSAAGMIAAPLQQGIEKAQQTPLTTSPITEVGGKPVTPTLAQTKQFAEEIAPAQKEVQAKSKMIEDLSVADPTQFGAALSKSLFAAPSIKTSPASEEQKNQYKERTGRDLPEGTTFEAADKLLGTAIRGSLAKSRQDLVDVARERLGVTKIKTVDDVFKQADPKRASPTSNIGREYMRLTSAQRMVAVAGTRAGQLTPQQVTTVASEVANLALAGGQSQRIASELIEKYVPETLGMTIAQKTQYLTSHPQDAKVQAVINPLIQEGLRIAITSEQNIRNTQKDIIAEASSIGDLSQQQYIRGAQRIGIDPNTLQETGDVLPGFNPREWYEKVKTLPEGTAVPDILKKSGTLSPQDEANAFFQSLGGK